MERVNHFRGSSRRLEDPPTLLVCTYYAAIASCATIFSPSTELFEDSWLNTNLIVEFTFHKWFKQFKMNLTWLFNFLTNLWRLFVQAGGPNGWAKKGKKKSQSFYLSWITDSLYDQHKALSLYCLTDDYFLNKSTLRAKYTTWNVIFLLNLCLISEELSKYGTYRTMLKTIQRYWK